MTRMHPEDSWPAEVEPLLDRLRLTAGAAVVYFDPEPAGDVSFRRAVATGPEIVDPRTKASWAPVTLTDRTLDLLPSALIVAVFSDDA
jgi:hypothetical protein